MYLYNVVNIPRLYDSGVKVGKALNYYSIDPGVDKV